MNSTTVNYTKVNTEATNYKEGHGGVQMVTTLFDQLLENANNSVILSDGNQSFTQVCDSNGTGLWKLTHPVCSTRYESFAAFIIVVIVLSLITLWTIIGNVLVVMALYYHRTLRTMSNCLIGNLAVSDLLLAITVLPISTSNDLLGYWVFGETMCTIWLCIDVFYCTASIWGLCTIAFDRYTATVYPVWYHDQRSWKKLVAYITFVWIFSIIISFAPFIGWPDMVPSFHAYNPKLNRYECVLFSTLSYVFYSAMGSFILPICLMVFLYIRIFFVIHKQSQTMNSKNSLSCFACTTSPKHETYFKGISADLETNNETSLPRDDTGLTVITESNPVIDGAYSVSDGQYYLDIKPLDDPSSSDIHNSQSGLDLDDISNIQKNMTSNHKQRTQSLQSSNPAAQYLLESRNHCDKLPQNGIKKSTSVTFEMENNHQNGTKRSDKRSKSVSIVTEYSSDSSDDKKNQGKKMSRSWHMSSLERRRNMTTSMKRRLELREQRATKRMLLIMASFFFCWVPFLVMYVTRSLCEDCYMNDHFVAVIIWLGYANSGLNPVLYTLFNEDFTKAFKKLLHIGKQSHSF